jgi:hypothetical protein
VLLLQRRMTTEVSGVLCEDASLDADLVWSAAAVTEIDDDYLW